MRTRVKVCGVTRFEDARLAVELGADFLGLNFWPQSPRFLARERAASIADSVRGEVSLVGVWVDPASEEVAATAAELTLDLLQFHGDVDPSLLARFPNRVIRAFRPAVDFDARVLEAFDQAWGFLFDCAPPGVHGGTGVSWPYERIADLGTAKPVLLAGGLTPANVADAVRRSGADIVDVCSGVESRPGVKDSELMRQFLREVENVETTS